MSKREKKIQLKVVHDELDENGENGEPIVLSGEKVTGLEDNEPDRWWQSDALRLGKAGSKADGKQRSGDVKTEPAPLMAPLRLEDSWSEEKPTGRVPMIWLAAGMALLLVGILWSLSQVSGSGEKQDQLKELTQRVIRNDVEREEAAQEAIAGMERAVTEFLTASSIEELIKNVRQPERVEPLMRGYYQENPLEPAVVKSISDFNPITLGQRGTFWMVDAEIENEKNQLIVVEMRDGENAKVDWEIAVNFQPMNWDKLVLERPANYVADFRVRVELDSLYIYEFSDSEKFMCVRLSAPDSLEHLFGYMDKSSEFADELEGLFSGRKKEKLPVILRLRVPENSKVKRAVIIEKVIAKRWIYIDPPEEK